MTNRNLFDAAAVEFFAENDGLRNLRGRKKVPRHRAAFTDAELNRVLRVARKHGAVAVEVTTPDAFFKIVLGDSGEGGNLPPVKVAKKEPIRLG
jgi:hypothetical protein